MGGRGASSSSNSSASTRRAEAHQMFRINRAILAADTKGAVRFQLEGNATPFRMTKNADNTYTIKSRNRIYGRNVTADRAKEILSSTQERFNRLNNQIKNSNSR